MLILDKKKKKNGLYLCLVNTLCAAMYCIYGTFYVKLCDNSDEIVQLLKCDYFNVNLLLFFFFFNKLTLTLWSAVHKDLTKYSLQTPQRKD